MNRENREGTRASVLRHLQIFALDDIDSFGSQGVIHSPVHGRGAEFADQKRLYRQPVRAKIGNAFNGCYRLAYRADICQKPAFLVVFNKGNDVNAMPLRQDANVVIHPNTAAMHPQDRSVGSEEQNVHEVRASTSRSVMTEYRMARWRRNRAPGKRSKARKNA